VKGELAVSIFGSIVSKIFGHANAAPAPATPPSGTASAPAPAPSAAPSQGSFNNPVSSAPSPGQTGAATSSPSAGAPAASGGSVDVTKILDDLAAKNSQTLNWRQSIVDLMKLLDLDSSLAARKELAQELHYSGSTDDSAAMNIWLHKQVMQKLAANGGKVPDDLK
jgi:hypothetical protein